MDLNYQDMLQERSFRRGMTFVGLVVALVACSSAATLAANPNQSSTSSTPTTLVAPPPPQVVTTYTYGPNGSPRTSTKSAPPAPGATPAVNKKADDETVVQTGRPITATVLNQWQTFTDYITIKPEMDTSSLVLKFVNGDHAPAFQDVRIYVNRKPAGSIRNFANGKYQTSVNALLQNGKNSLTFQALGPVGASLSWKLTESKLQVTSVNPNAFQITDKVVVVGKSFPTSGMKVTIGNVPVPVSGATPTQLTLRTPLPDSLPGGKQDLIVSVGSKRSVPIKVTVKLTPEVSSCDFVSTAPGQPLTISGKNFSPNASENVVTIGGQTAQVTSASPTSLSVIVPLTIGGDFPVWYAPIKVKTNDVESKGEVTVDIGQRVIPNTGSPQL
jgi:hypothetical protein